MADDQIPSDAQLNAGEAGMLLGHPLLRNAFDRVEMAVIAHIKSLTFGPEESEVVRDKLMLTLQVIDQVKEQLQEHIDTALIENSNREKE